MPFEVAFRVAFEIAFEVAFRSSCPLKDQCHDQGETCGSSSAPLRTPRKHLMSNVATVIHQSLRESNGRLHIFKTATSTCVNASVLHLGRPAKATPRSRSHRINCAVSNMLIHQLYLTSQRAALAQRPDLLHLARPAVRMLTEELVRILIAVAADPYRPSWNWNWHEQL